VLLATSVVSAARAAGPSVTLSPAASRLAAYLAIDTTNPPGNERAGAELLAGLLRAAGIEPQRFVSPRGRVNLLARLEATPRAQSGAAGGDAPPVGTLVLLHHIDTVPAGSGWRQGAPAAGAVHDGELWGRGAIDTKGLGIAHLTAFLDLARSPLPRRRAVVFLAVADEEAGGGEGAGWLLSAHPELFADVDAVLNEGGVNKAVAGRTLFWGIEVDQKRPLWLEVSTAGRAGHASAANPASATHRLVSGLAALVAAPRPRRVTPAATQFLVALARFDPQARAALAQLRELERHGDASDSRPLSLPGFESLLTDTLQITTLAGSERINVVAGEARAGIDVRLLPDTDEQAFVAGIERALGPGFTVKVRLTSPAAPPSPVGSADFRTLAATLATAGASGAGGAGGATTAAVPNAPAVPVVPAFIAAFTDSRYFRTRGIAAYGFSPFALDGLLLRTVHAPDERIPLATLDRGVETMIRVVRALALADPAESAEP
jgi:acetylornithine deacetylase/succinyl-diaminopimelate desuccinylase-like protein